MFEFFGIASRTLVELYRLRSDTSSREQKTYEKKLETAKGIDIFKYTLLINQSALEGYIAQTRLQAHQSFQLSKIVAIVGFVILMISIGLSVYYTSTGNNDLNPAYLSGVAGVITEFIAGIFFFLYNKTLQQINIFHDKLAAMQLESMNHLAKRMENKTERKLAWAQKEIDRLHKINNSE
jgi:hypothetical protein